MPDITILKESELREIISLDIPVIDGIEEAFRLLATRDVVMPPILSLHIPDHNGEVDIKTAYVPGIDSFAIKMSPGFFDNPKLGLPSLNGLMVLFSAKTGLVEALLLDNGYLTDIRTAAAGAVAARWLSRKDARTAGIIGSGLQARLQLKALTLVRKIETAIIWGRDPKKSAECASECAQALGIEVLPCGSIDDLCDISDIIVTTTPTQTPLLSPAHLRPGQHITAMGSDADYKNEIAPELLAAVDHYIPDRLSQCLKQGELRAAVSAGVVPADTTFPELGQIVARQAMGRQSEHDITLCDLTGTGVQDTAIATLAFGRSRRAGAGTVFTS